MRVRARATLSERVSHGEPESDLQSLKVSLRVRVTLGVNQGCQSLRRQFDLENKNFHEVFIDLC